MRFPLLLLYGHLPDPSYPRWHPHIWGCQLGYIFTLCCCVHEVSNAYGIIWKLHTLGTTKISYVHIIDILSNVYRFACQSWCRPWSKNDLNQPHSILRDWAFSSEKSGQHRRTSYITHLAFMTHYPPDHGFTPCVFSCFCIGSPIKEWLRKLILNLAQYTSYWWATTLQMMETHLVFAFVVVQWNTLSIYLLESGSEKPGHHPTSTIHMYTLY